MLKIKNDSTIVNRRALLAGASATPLIPVADFSALPHQFDRWVAEAYATMDLAWSIPEEPEGPRDRLFQRVDELDRLILRTPSLDEPAIRAKFGFLRWIAKNDADPDERIALDHLGEFIRQHCTGPWDLYTPR
ncbi:MAG: hypothetical protein EPO51_18000 [Phenylobacterium sp.]|uniref:hypothetical protein n=1 Tax=Phenylobacterium sp. TaxID=1871053 RepID=UPI00121F42E1|nr:hypothetical protein [Phenylobacterium sp.]TAJ70423.1 MAG: hypothetical protein EPO51_18000 [Phenylobacterium sp.]